MNLPLFDQTRERELSSYGEAVRLSNELRAKPARSVINYDGERIDYPAKDGFDCEIAEYNQFIIWLNDSNKKKSRSLFWFVIRIMSIRFPEKHNEIRNSLSDRNKVEYGFILSEMSNEIEWFGLTGYQNQVELNPSSELNIKNIKVIKGNNDTYKTVKK